MKATAKLSDLMDAIELPTDEHYVAFDRQEGRIVSVEQYILRAVETGELEELKDVPEWQKQEIETARAIVADTGDRFIDAPDKFEFHEYRQMERFIGSLNDARTVDELWRAIKGRGAFRYFKDTAHRFGLLEQWFRYRDEAVKEFVIAWAEANHVDYEDDTRKRRS